MITFVRNFQSVLLQSGHPILHSHQQWIRVLLLHIHDRFGSVSVLDFGLSNRCVVVSHWFNLHLPSNKWCGKSFHVLICHLYIFYGEVSIKVLGSFFNWAVFLLLTLKCSLYILGNSLSSDVLLFLKYIFPVCGFSSHSLAIVYCKSEISNLMKSSLATISLMYHAFGIESKRSLPNPKLCRFSHTLSSRNIIVLCFSLRSEIHFELFWWL